MSTDIEIANLALARLSMESIASLTDGTDRAKKVRPVFLPVFRRFLTMHDWSFATRQIPLKLLAFPEEQIISAPHRNAFALPADYVKMQAFFPNGMRHPAPTDFPYRVMRYANDRPQALFTDADSVEIRYTSSAALIGDFSPAAADALACLLAVELTLNIKNSTERAEMLIQRYQDALRSAIRDDIKSKSVEKMPGHGYTAARFSWECN